MKRFKDLKVGDSIYVENDLRNVCSVYDIVFEKLFITDIKSDPSSSFYTFYTSNGKIYKVRSDLSRDCSGNDATWVYTEKEAVISFFEKQLKDYKAQTHYFENFFKLQIKKAEML
jgi:hypothetical protein